MSHRQSGREDRRTACRFSANKRITRVHYCCVNIRNAAEDANIFTNIAYDLSDIKRHNHCDKDLAIHYANTSVQYTAIFHGSKNDNFQIKFLIFFLFLLKT